MTIKIDDWQTLVNKPVFSSDGKDVGVVADIQPEALLVTYGPITPDKYIIPKNSISRFEQGVVYLEDSGNTVEREYKYE